MTDAIDAEFNKLVNRVILFTAKYNQGASSLRDISNARLALHQYLHDKVMEEREACAKSIDEIADAVIEQSDSAFDADYKERCLEARACYKFASATIRNRDNNS